jgi:ATP-dependent Clp protease ATP-binding subunit ClpA
VFERYTERARRIIFFARYEAAQLGSPSIETEHLLLGLLREGAGLVRQILDRHGVEPVALRRGIEAGASRERTTTSVDIPLSQAAQRVLMHASEEAQREKSDHIGADHILVGLLMERRAAEVLQQAGLTVEATRRDLTAIRESRTHAPELSGSGMAKLLQILETLEARRHAYHLSHPARQAIRVGLAHRDERWEVDFFADGHVEVVVFTGSPMAEGEEALRRLFE